MDFLTSIALGTLFGIAFAWPIHRLDITVRRKLNRVGFLADIAVGSMMVSFALNTGTASGLIIAIIAAVTFTAYMSFSKWQVGSQKWW